MESDKEIISQDTLRTESLVIDIVQSETKNQPHNGEQIDRMIVSPDMSYVVTYSKADNSISGWSVDIEKDGQQQHHVGFVLDKSYEISSFVLYKKILLFYYNEPNELNNYRKYLYFL